MKSIALWLIGCVLWSQTHVRRLDGVSLSPKAMDATIERLMAAGNVHGLGVAVLNNGQVVYSRTFGLRDASKGLPLTPDTVLCAHSFTKSVFATLVMGLVQDGALDLDRPIAAYLPKPLPEYEKYKDLATDERHHRLTLRILLGHTAGFANFAFLEPDGKLRIHFEPGSRYAYSGEGINLAQLVVESATGKRVPDLLEGRFYKPLGMKRSAMTWREDFAADFAVGHDPQGRPMEYRRRSSARAAGTMVTTLSDFTLFVKALMAGRLLDAKSKAEMLKPRVRIRSRTQFPTLSEETTRENDGIQLSYGVGWGLFKSKAHGWAYFKEGHDDGWWNHVVCFEDKKTALILMSNSQNASGIFKALLEELLGDRETPWRWEGYVPLEPPKP